MMKHGHTDADAIPSHYTNSLTILRRPRRFSLSTSSLRLMTTPLDPFPLLDLPRDELTMVVASVESKNALRLESETSS